VKVLEVVAAVLTLEDGRVLACRRRPDIAAGGAWEFPGGKVEPGEQPEAALEREILEELGARIRVETSLGTQETVVGERVIRLTCYRATARAELPTHSTDHDQLEWLDPADLASVEWAEPDVPFVRMLSER